MDHEIVEVDTVRLSPVLWNSLVSEIETTLLVFFLLPSDGREIDGTWTLSP